MSNYMNFVNEDFKFAYSDTKDLVYKFTVKCKNDTTNEIIQNLRLTMIYSEHGVTIKYKRKIIKQLLYRDIESWKLINNLFYIKMYDVKYIFKIKNNEGIYCNLAMGYFTHKLAYQYLIEKNRELQLENI